MAVEAKAIVLQKNELGQIRIRVDFDVDVGEPLNKAVTQSRRMEGVLPIQQVNALEADYNSVFNWLDENGIPPE